MNWVYPLGEIGQTYGISDGISVKMVKVEELKGNSLKDLGMSSCVRSRVPAGRRRFEKLSLLEVAALFETYVKTGASTLNLGGKLKDQVEWLPLSLGKLSNLTEIDISENQILALPSNLDDLKALRMLDVHSNQLINLPGSFGVLGSLTDLNLYANRLKSLPVSFGNLVTLVMLDLSSNSFVTLPDRKSVV